ncbi:DUF1566 domain-containing protein [Alcaligenes aquatilis]|uniref:DUF1566 domain-containing protein n=1 Tax=Alcaligenes aquatilis TaxID=323284 RepID=A0A3G2HXA3_9BURK|nr:DUF1566 domain-containing protein [Alcaligenes aquatilis]AYN21619.1 DUF1566 domain-containing protein [Alcaligenes aquatilis]
MTVITLEAIKTEQNRVAEMIAAFEAQAATTYRIPEADITLQPGEHYAGIVLDEEGNPACHLILLPDEKEGANWKDAVAWAKSIGGDLPKRCEQSLLFANLASHFKKAWYWSSELHKDDSGYAWSQTFCYGGQGYNAFGTKCRARAVRRLIIQ